MELVAGTSHFGLRPSDAEGLQELCAGLAGQVFQITTQNRGALVIGQIGNRQPRGDEAKAPVEAGQLAQQRLEGGLAQTPFLRTGRVLHRLQAVKHEQLLLKTTAPAREVKPFGEILKLCPRNCFVRSNDHRRFRPQLPARAAPSRGARAVSPRTSIILAELTRQRRLERCRGRLKRQQRRRAWARWAGWLPALGHRPFERKPLFDLIASRRPHRIQQYLGSCQH
jgi:hypothetical protein